MVSVADSFYDLKIIFGYKSISKSFLVVLKILEIETNLWLWKWIKMPTCQPKVFTKPQNLPLLLLPNSGLPSGLINKENYLDLVLD